MVAGTYSTSTTPEQIEQQQAEKKAKETAIVKISKYLGSEIVKSRFQDVLGDRSAGAYISSVVVAVKESTALQECHPESIYISALRAATLRLSVDPALGQAYMVPYSGRATLVVGYKGLYDMAVRTGKYRYINVGPIYEGQEVEENQITGFHSISGKRTGDKVIGWIGAFEMNPERGQTTGFGKTFYMTVEEIHEHAKAYSKAYNNKKSPWQTETRKMERKTVMRLMIRRWGYLNPTDVAALEEVESEGETIDADIYNPDLPNVPEYDEEAETHKRTAEENIQQLGFGS
jgi:recombination protein RecT